MLNSVISSHAGIIAMSIADVNRRAGSMLRHDVAMTPGQRIKALRIGYGMSGAALARAMGIKQPSLWAIEHGSTQELKAETLMAAAKALRANPLYLQHGIGSPVTPIDPNAEEAQVVDLFRRLSEQNQAAWVEIGNTLLRSQPQKTAHSGDPFPTAAAPRSRRK